jgi:hypothetical protein
MSSVVCYERSAWKLNAVDWPSWKPFVGTIFGLKYKLYRRGIGDNIVFKRTELYLIHADIFWSEFCGVQKCLCWPIYSLTSSTASSFDLYRMLPMLQFCEVAASLLKWRQSLKVRYDWQTACFLREGFIVTQMVNTFSSLRKLFTYLSQLNSTRKSIPPSSKINFKSTLTSILRSLKSSLH